MKKEFLSGIIVVILALASFNQSSAQCKGDFGADKPATEIRLALYGDAYRAGKFADTRGALNWLFINAPKVSTKIYVDGVDVYDKLATSETDLAKKEVYLDSIMIIYDLRIANCGDEALVLNRKANTLFKHHYKNKAKLGEILALYDKIWELRGNNIMDQSLDLYMKTTQLHATFNKGSLTDDQILERYDRISAAIDAKTKKAMEEGKAQDVEALKIIRTKVDETLTLAPVKFDCPMVKAKLEPKFRQNPTDQALAKKIFTYMLQGKCTDDPLWLEAGEVFKNVEPKDFGLIKTLAIKHLSNGNTAKADALIKEALAIATQASEKSEAQMIMGSIEIKKGNSIGARELLRQAAVVDPKNKEAYSKIGDLYYNSFNDCAKRQNMAEDRLVYIAAYDMYQRAGDGQGMAKAKSQFPSKEDIFLLNWKVGESKKISCWVGETVTLRTRD
jgi:Flp pilus assembly protein TadD